MDVLLKFRRFENLHIVFWLIKDACWLMEYKIPATLMIFPTVSLALYLAVRTRQSAEFFLSLAVFFWISANSFWMLMEFFNHDLYKDYAALPFALGILSVAVYYLLPVWRGRQA